MKFVIKSKDRINCIKKKTLGMLKKYDVDDKDIYIFVSDDKDYNQYTENFPNCNIILGDKGIVGIDNFIVNYFDEGEKYIYMNDDVSKLYKLENLKRVELDKTDFYDLIDKLFNELEKNNYTFAGLYVCTNTLFMSRLPEIVYDLFLIMDPFSAVINNKEIQLTSYELEKEDGSIYTSDMGSDAEKCILHFKSRGGLVRFNHYCMKVDYYNNKKDGGGIVGRNSLTEKLSKEALMKKYPKYISSVNFKKNGTTQVRLRHLKRLET